MKQQGGLLMNKRLSILLVCVLILNLFAGMA